MSRFCLISAVPVLIRSSKHICIIFYVNHLLIPLQEHPGCVHFTTAIIHSTTIALPAWRKTCDIHKLPIRLIPRDVKTHWNSTYDMAKVALKYRSAIDEITANKSLKLRKFELDDDDWKIISDLL